MIEALPENAFSEFVSGAAKELNITRKQVLLILMKEIIVEYQNVIEEELDVGAD